MRTGWGRLEIGENLDADGEIRITVDNGDSESSDYIDKQNSIEIIKHLSKVFDIDLTKV